jgi:hypothetical protein
VGRGFLERLQHRVLAFFVKRIGGLDHEYTLVTLERPKRRPLDQLLADVGDRMAHAGRPQPDQVGVRRGIKQSAAPGFVGVGAALGEDLGSEGAGGSRLAGADRAGQQISVGRALAKGSIERTADPGLIAGGFGKSAHRGCPGPPPTATPACARAARTRA